jgi:hypothetical protein
VTIGEVIDFDELFFACPVGVALWEEYRKRNIDGLTVPPTDGRGIKDPDVLLAVRGIDSGRGGVFLKLTPEQYAKLTQPPKKSVASFPENGRVRFRNAQSSHPSIYCVHTMLTRWPYIR